MHSALHIQTKLSLSQPAFSQKEEDVEGMMQTSATTHLLPRSHSALLPHVWQLFSLMDFPGNDEAPCQPGEGRECTACTSLSCASLLKPRVYRLYLDWQFLSARKYTFEAHLPNILTYCALVYSLGAHKVDPFQMKLHQKTCSQKATNTSQLLTSCSCWQHPSSGEDTWGQERTAGPDSSDHDLAAGDHVTQETRQQVPWTMQCHRNTGALRIQHYLVSTVINTLYLSI